MAQRPQGGCEHGVLATARDIGVESPPGGGCRFHFRVAASAVEMRARLETIRPEIVLLDVNLPDADGIAPARAS